MDKELDELLCLLDGKITVYRQKNKDSKITILNIRMNSIQKEIQRLWNINKNSVEMILRCSTCIFKFECLAKHHIPENYGNDCTEYKKVMEGKE